MTTRPIAPPTDKPYGIAMLEIEERQARSLATIAACLRFWVILACIGIGIGVIGAAIFTLSLLNTKGI